MKKPHVLNRPMFNKGGTSAYGRGIASNLVSDEQRQRFNYGGRVGLCRTLGQSWWDGIDDTTQDMNRWQPELYGYQFWGTILLTLKES